MFQNNSKEKNKGRVATFSLFLLIKIQWLWGLSTGIENTSNCLRQTYALICYEKNKKNYLLTVIYSELLFLFSNCRN